MKNFSRRNFVQSGALIAAAGVTPRAIPLLAQPSQAAGKPLPIHLGGASYTFRNFARDKMIGFMKHLNFNSLNAKDLNHHLPIAPHPHPKPLPHSSAAAPKPPA